MRNLLRTGICEELSAGGGENGRKLEGCALRHRQADQPLGDGAAANRPSSHAARLSTVAHLAELIPYALVRYVPDLPLAGGPASPVVKNPACPFKEDRMLLLSRKTAETIVINETVVVKVVKIAGGRVALGIEAPSEISIRRGELASPAPLPAAVAYPQAPSLAGT